MPNIDDAYGEQDHNLENCTVGAQPSEVTMASGSMLPSIRRPAAPRLADYSAFVAKQTGQTFDITIGATMNFKDRLVLGNCDVFNPNVDDPGQTGVHAVTLNFLGKYYATDASAMKLTRNAP